MRIVWDNKFVAELIPGSEWRNDMEAVKAAGFKTTGQPSWQWYTQKAEPINKLRKNKPSSGLTMTELAFEKYNHLNQKLETKLNLRKDFKKTQKQAAKIEPSNLPMYFDQDLGFECVIVKPCTAVYVHQYIRPPDPEQRCLACDSPLWPPFEDGRSFCMWCEITLDKQSIP